MANDTSKLNIGNNIYDIKDTVARDEKINKSEIAEPYDSTKEYNAGDIFEYNGELFQVLLLPPEPEGGRKVEKITICDIYRGIWLGTSEELNTAFVPWKSFAFTTDDNEKIWFNTIYLSNPVYTNFDNKYHCVYIRTAINDIDGVPQWGLIIAKNDLTGIDNIADAERLLKVEKQGDEYVASYANSSITKSNVQGHTKSNNVNLSKGTSPIAYIRAYAVFKNDDNTETVMYTPCQMCSWEET